MSKLLVTLPVVLFLASPLAMAQSTSQGATEVIIKGVLRPKPAENIPPPPLELFVQTPRVEHIALSADGSRFAFVTRKGGLRLLTTYNVNDASDRSIRLSEDPLSAIAWLDNDHIMLSDTQTGIRGTCPAGAVHTLKTAQAVSDYSYIIVEPISDRLGMDNGAAGRAANLGKIIALTPPACADYGVRSQDAASIVDLRNSTSISLGDKMVGDYNHLPLGLPKPVMIDGKMQLAGGFLELRDKSIAGQVAQRVYLWRVDPDTGLGRMIDDGGGDLDRLGRYVDDWLVDSAGQPLARAHYSYLDTTFRIEMKKDGRWKPVLTRKIESKQGTVAPLLVGLGRDGVSLLILDMVHSPDGSRRFHYYELSADGKLSEALDSGDATRDRPIFHPETGALAGLEHDGERTTYTFFDPDLAEYYRLAIEAAPGKAVRVAAMARDPHQMILFAQGSDDTGAWHYFDFVAGKRVDIGQQYPSVPPEWVASQRPVRYKAADGLEIGGLLTLPSQGEATKRALIVLPHDGPLAHDARGFNWLAQVLASRGYLVLQPNYRGSDGYGLPLTEAGYGQWSGRMLSDMDDGVRYLTQQGIIDPKRVCIIGQGYGGYAALRGADGDGPYRCAVAINGISDPGDYAANMKKYAPADDMAGLMADAKQSRAFRTDPASPELLGRYFGNATPSSIMATSIQVPTLLVHGERDKVVPPDQSRTLRDGGQKTGQAISYVELPDCDHDLSTEGCRLGAAQAVVDFLALNNPAK
ncbi:prolyl oligopeptidase family protein [Asticcacaulis biprosthecium C19]|uniref:Prolyl oligopeptidase family protein n=1 Tax=Asticcacaulis biprosthecium C19 TaxID=715226 RepID=F4QS84_9CAUL|nr:prolyl oligopeptidase family serine peptidase [Asticcacaulis biprosthecium]EGF89604.1 prolyl oligopeptidase family protein [Asticcacaulis biprosthecium C19]